MHNICDNTAKLVAERIVTDPSLTNCESEYLQGLRANYSLTEKDIALIAQKVKHARSTLSR